MRRKHEIGKSKLGKKENTSVPGGYQPPGTEINHNVKRLGEFV